MEATWTHPSAPTGPARRRAPVAAVLVLGAALTACSIGSAPGSTPVGGLVPTASRPLGYVACGNAVTPVELATRTAEAPIPLPVQGTPTLGNYAVTTTPDGRHAYVVTQSTAATGSVRDVVVPIDLTTQRAGRPIVLPGDGATHAVVVTHDGRTVLAATGTAIVPVDPATRAVGTPLDLGPGRTIAGLALDPVSPTLYAVVPDGVVPVDTQTAAAGPLISTGLAVSAVSSPHSAVVTADGSTVYVVGQGGADFGGRLVAITAATRAVGPATSFDQFGIADPAAVTVTADGATVLVADTADNWVIPVPAHDLAAPSDPVRLPTGAGTTMAGTDHPTDVVTGPGTTGSFVVTGLDTVLPFSPATRSFGRPIRVCAGAASMAVAGS